MITEDGEIKENTVNVPGFYRFSTTTASIFAAFAEAQAELKNPEKSKCVSQERRKRDGGTFNLQYSYAPLDVIVDEIRRVFPKHGISYSQAVSGDQKEVTCVTVLTHSSGEWMETKPLSAQPTQEGVQGMGSAISYLRRYQLSAAVGIASADEDDDGNASMGQAATIKDKSAARKQEVRDTRPQQAAPKPAPKPAATDNSMSTPEQQQTIITLCKKAGLHKEDLDRYLQEGYRKTRTRELTSAEADSLIDYIKTVKEEALSKFAEEVKNAPVDDPLK
jgi:hypothetical protein